MQEYSNFEDTEYISDAPTKLNKNMQSIITDFSGASFPTANLFVGMKCLRTDENNVYRLHENASNQLVWELEYTIIDGGIKVKQADNASSATKATNDANNKAITSYVAKVEVGSAQGTIKVTDGAGKSTEFTSYAIATQTEVETGDNNTKVMTPMGVKKAIGYNNATNRLPNTSYAVGNVVYDRSNLSVALRCTTAGATSNTELDISGNNIGDTVTDGTVVWEVVSRDLSEALNSLQSNVDNALLKLLPVGTSIMYMGDTVPDGYLPENGAAISRTTYSKLFAVIGTKCGAGDGSTTFNLPNKNNGSFAEGSNTAGTVKSAGLPNLYGTYRDHDKDNGISVTGVFSKVEMTTGRGQWAASDGQHIVTFDASAYNAIYGNSDTVQPKAVTVKYCIKY